LLSEPAKAIDLRVARRIRERRQRIGMTQQKLAQMIGVAFQQAHKYEHGLSRVSAGRLFQIATALGVPIVYFFLQDEEAAALELPGPPGEGDKRDE
jgi:transcriptional regulator with XRE-family HTH domain